MCVGGVLVRTAGSAAKEAARTLLWQRAHRHSYRPHWTTNPEAVAFHRESVTGASMGRRAGLLPVGVHTQTYRSHPGIAGDDQGTNHRLHYVRRSLGRLPSRQIDLLQIDTEGGRRPIFCHFPFPSNATRNHSLGGQASEQLQREDVSAGGSFGYRLRVVRRRRHDGGA